MNYSETIEYLFSALPMFHRIGPAAYKANLDNTHLLCKLFDHPENDLKCIHVAGTNGKGSVSHILASILQSAGFKTGLYTSPHLKDFRERIRINGAMVSEEWVSNFVSKHQQSFEEIKPSFFEMTTAMAFKYFHDHQTDIAVIETGLGGRLDSTNVLTPHVSVITNIGLDHMNLLGNTLEKIAIEKAGIIKSNIPIVIGEYTSTTKLIFTETSNRLSAPIYFASENFEIIAKEYNPLEEHQTVNIFKHHESYFKNVICDLSGKYQLKNIATVIQTISILKELGFQISENNIRDGLKNVKKNTGLQGRWQIINRSPITICDTGHNEDGLREVLPLLQEISHENLHIVLGMVNDKEIEKILELFPKDAIYYFCKANIPRGLDPSILAEKASVIGLKGIVFESVSAALHSAQKKALNNDIVFVGGSTFTVAEII